MIDPTRLRDRDTRPHVQFIRYGIVGASATLLDLVIFSVLSLWVFPAVDFELGDDVRVHRSTINTGMAFLVANIYTYIINVKFVFLPGRHPRGLESAIFLAVSVVSFGIGLWVMRTLIATFSVATIVAKLAGLGPPVVINYACRRFIIFKT